MKWTQEVKALVADMLLEKLSASQIKTRLAPGIVVSRNALIGVVHRDKALRGIGFHWRTAHPLVGNIPKPPKPAKRIKQSKIAGVLSRPRKYMPQKQSLQPAWLPPKQFIHELGDYEPDRGSMFMYPPKLPKRLAVPLPAAFECRSIPLMELKRGECKWAVNNAPPKGIHLFCGNPAETGKPYCTGHAQLSYQSRRPLDQLQRKPIMSNDSDILPRSLP